jgi:hypothetical protein
MADAWRSRAFGLEIEGDFDAPGLPPVDDPGAVDTRVRLDDDCAWPAGGATRLLEERFDDDEPARTIDHRPGYGYRLYARHFGLAVISEDGGEVRCAPPQDEPWSWQRFLVGRVLPWAAVVRGRELLHASAVAVDGRAVVLLGPTGTGKTTLAARLVLGGARLLTDDALAVDAELRAHPGPALLCVRPSERDVARIGTVLGVSGKTYVAVDREPAPVPLAALLFLEQDGTGPAIEPCPPHPRQLLGCTFNESLRSPERLRRHFEICTEIAERVPLYRFRLGRSSEEAARAGLAFVEAL